MELTSGPSLSLLLLPQHLLALLKCQRGLDLGRFSLSLCGIFNFSSFFV